MQVTDIAESVADAKDYLVNRLTGQVTVTIKGESRQLRIVSEKDFFPLPVWTQGIDNPADLMPQTQTYELEFWDANHGLRPGEEISVDLQPEERHGYMSVLKGMVVTVAEQKVSIARRETLTSRETFEC